MGGGTTPPYNETFTVTFYSNTPNGTAASGTMIPQAFISGQPFTLAKNAFSIEGYTFRGWAENISATEAEYVDEEEVTLYDNLVLYAVWQNDDVPNAKNFTVTFYPNTPNGTAASGTMIPQTFISGQPFTLAKNAFSIEGYTFRGWAENISATEAKYTDEAKITVSKNLELYAVWEKDENNHTVTFYANAPHGFTAQGSMPPQSSKNSWLTLAKNAFSIPLHIFKGWATDDSSKEVVYKDEEELYNFTDDIKLYAVWEYWLSYDEDGNLIVQIVDDIPSDVVIPEGVTTIGETIYFGGTFTDIFENFTTLTIPSTLKNIDTGLAFTNMKPGFWPLPFLGIDKRTKGLPFKFIVDEKNPYFKTNESGNMLLSKDGNELYFVTNSSSDYTIPSTVRNIKAGAFIGADIQSINLDGVTLEANCTFQNCTKLTSVVLKNITKTDGSDIDPSQMFSNCIALENADLSGCNIKRMLNTFANCTSLTEVKLPETLENMDATFDGCTSLTKFAIPASVTHFTSNLGTGNGRSVSIAYPKTIEDYKKIRNNDASGYFLPSVFGGNVNVTVTCSDGKVIYTAGSDEIKAE